MVTPARALPAGELAWPLWGPIATIRMSVTTVDTARLRHRPDRYIGASSRTTSGHINVVPFTVAAPRPCHPCAAIQPQDPCVPHYRLAASDTSFLCQPVLSGLAEPAASI